MQHVFAVVQDHPGERLGLQRVLLSLEKYKKFFCSVS
jgi:hypothetical protein